MAYAYVITYGHVTHYSGWTDEDIFERVHEAPILASSFKCAADLVRKDAEATWREGRYAGKFPGVAIRQAPRTADCWHCQFVSSKKNNLIVNDTKDLPWFMMIRRVEIKT